MQSVKKQEIQFDLTPAIFTAMDLEASLGTLGRIEDFGDKKKKMREQLLSLSSLPHTSCPCCVQWENSCKRTNMTRTSAQTPFLKEVRNDTKDISNNSGSSSLMLKPYPISETDHEIRDRERLHESVDWSSSLVVNSPPSISVMDQTSSIENADQQSMMEVTVDDFVLSAEEAGSLTDYDLDARTIQDDGFWESSVQIASTPWIHSSDTGTMASVPFSVTFANQEPFIDDIDEHNGLADAAPIRSIDMEW